MKQGNLILRILIGVLFAGILAYFGIYFWNAFTANTGTATLYTYTAEERVSSKGYFFRNETVLSQQSETAEVLCAEGEKVGNGDEVVRIYSSAEDYKVQKELDEAKAELQSLNYILSRTGDASDTMELDGDIVDTFTSLQAMVSSGQLTDLRNEGNELRSLIFRRDYTYNGADTLNQRIADAQAKVDELSARVGASYESVTAPEAGLYSANVDGYEGIMTLEALDGITPSALSEMAGAPGAVDDAALGKLITNSGWYFACNLSEADTKNIHTESNVKLRFADSARIYTAQVQYMSSAEDGMVTAVFHSKNYAPQLAGLRNQSVEIITGTATGFRTPKRAVRVDENGQLGIFRISGAQARWVPVTILWEEEEYYIIKQAPKLDEEGNPAEETQYEKAARLREGNTVIVTGDHLYDGKVVD